LLIAHADLAVQIPQRAAAEAAMTELQGAASAQEGCLSFAFAEVVGEPGRYVVLESWRDRDALEAHFRTAAYREYQTTISALLVRETSFELFRAEPLARLLADEELDLRQDD
jgi:quinol monooxygenase YgiN